MLSRRQVFLGFWASLFLVTASSAALAKDGDGGDSGGGDSGGGDSGGGDSGGDDSGGDDSSGDDSDSDSSNDDDQDEARNAVTRGEATALRDILAKVKKKYAGEIVHVDLKKRSNRLVYMIKLIDPSGKLLLVRIDARNGAILGVQRI